VYSQNDIVNDLLQLGIEPSRPLLVHSSMKAIGDVDGGAETVLNALISVMDGGLLVLPTHSWASMFRDNAVFDPAVEPSCAGILTELFRARPGVVRSLHPTHSVAALGPGAQKFVAGEEHHRTPCPRNGVMGKLVDMDGRILFLGCPLTKNTLIHGVEEWANIPDRVRTRTDPMRIRLPDGSEQDCPMHCHDIKNGDISLNYGKLLGPFLTLNACIEGTVGDARTMLCHAQKMVEITNRFLDKDKDLFGNAEPIPREWY
jgi:aminoglycoside 3-N-acetyltransferase